MSKKIATKLTKQSVMDNITKYISALFIVVLLVLLTATQENFLGTYNLKNLLRDPAPLMLMATGMGMGLLLGSVAVSVSTAILPFALAFAGGTMLYVISDEMIPETHSNGNERIATYALLSGVVLMILMDVFIGG